MLKATIGAYPSVKYMYTRSQKEHTFKERTYLTTNFIQKLDPITFQYLPMADKSSGVQDWQSKSFLPPLVMRSTDKNY